MCCWLSCLPSWQMCCRNKVLSRWDLDSSCVMRATDHTPFSISLYLLDLKHMHHQMWRFLWGARQLYYNTFTENTLHKINWNLSFFYSKAHFIVTINLDLLPWSLWTLHFSLFHLVLIADALIFILLLLSALGMKTSSERLKCKCITCPCVFEWTCSQHLL